MYNSITETFETPVLPKPIHIQESSGIPIYIQLKTQLEYWIATGQIPEEVQLPSVRALATQLGIAIDTVRQAYEALEQQGLVTTRRGLGTYTCLPKGRQAALAGDDAGRLHQQVNAFLAETLRAGYSLPLIHRTIQHRMALLQRGPIITFIGVRASIRRYAAELSHALEGMPATPVAIEDLRAKPDKIIRALHETTHVVTLVFHAQEVDAALSQLPVRILPLVSRLDEKVVRAIGKLPRGARPMLVCREASRPIYSEMIKEQRPADEILLFARDDSRDEIVRTSRDATVILHTTVARAAVERARVTALPWIELLHSATIDSLDHVARAIRSDWEQVLQLQNIVASPVPAARV